MLVTFREVKDWLVNTYREWYKKRWIPLDICENDWEHTKWSTKACVAHLAWSPWKIEDKKWFPIMWLWHELVEWEPDMHDYTPWCNITPEEKHRLEAGVLNRLRTNLSEKYSKILDKTEEYLDWKTSDAQEFFYIDKALAWVWALEYERLWHTWLDEFHPYALSKLSDDNLHHWIYKTLLEREFDKNFYQQYLLLLRVAWNRDEFYSWIESIV
jgi:hypothetical protein